MPLKHWVDDWIFLLTRTYQTIRRVVRPVDTHADRKRHEEEFKGVLFVRGNELVAHAGEGDVVDPGGVGSHELRRAGREEFGDALVVFLGRGDHPAGEGEHEVEGGDAFGEVGDVCGRALMGRGVKGQVLVQLTGEFVDHVGH